MRLSHAEILGEVLADLLGELLGDLLSPAVMRISHAENSS